MVLTLPALLTSCERCRFERQTSENWQLDKGNRCSTCEVENEESLLETSGTQDFTWRIHHFAELPLDLGYRAGAELLTFLGSKWSIQTYPNGLDENETAQQISFMLRRSGAHATTRPLLLKLGIQEKNGQNTIMATQALKESDLELGPIILLPLSEACKDGNNFLENGTITMFCRVLTETTGTEATGSSEVPRIMREGIDEHVSGETTSACFKEVVWKLTQFSAMPKEIGYYLVSDEFPFEGSTYCMRLYPNGWSVHDRMGCIYLMLLRSSSHAHPQRVTCKIGLRGVKKQVLEKHYLKDNENVLGPMNLLSRTDIDGSHFIKNDTIVAFCYMEVY